MLDEFVEILVANPLLTGAALPFVVGLANAALVRAVARRRIASLAMLGALAAFLVIYLVIQGAPPLLPVTATQKLFWLTLAGGVAGVAVLRRRRAGAFERAVLVLLPAAGVLWLGENQWLRGPGTGFVILSIMVWLVGAAILLRLRATDRTANGFAGGAQTVVAAAGLALITLAGGLAPLAILAGALAAGLGGVLLLDYAVFLFKGGSSGLGPVGRLAIAFPLIMLATILVLVSDGVSYVAVAVLSLVFLSGRILLRLDRERKLFARIGEPIWAVVLAAIPAVVAISIAALQADLTRYP